MRCRRDCFRVPGVSNGVYDQFNFDDSELRRQYTTWAVFLNTEKKVDDTHTVSFGAGHSQRPSI